MSIENQTKTRVWECRSRIPSLVPCASMFYTVACLHDPSPTHMRPGAPIQPFFVFTLPVLSLWDRSVRVAFTSQFKCFTVSVWTVNEKEKFGRNLLQSHTKGMASSHMTKHVYNSSYNRKESCPFYDFTSDSFQITLHVRQCVPRCFISVLLWTKFCNEVALWYSAAYLAIRALGDISVRWLFIHFILLL